MNFKFLIVALALATTVSCVDQSTYFSDACAWREALQAQIKLLTPNGQQIFTQILLDLQNLMGYYFKIIFIIIIISIIIVIVILFKSCCTTNI
jgi:hypothetical protein